mgnify:CR=1 FL=1
MLFRSHQNRDASGRVRCLQAEQGETVAAVLHEMRSLNDGESCFLAVSEGAALHGAIGAEVDPSLSRAWLRGPVCSGAVAADPVLRDRLFDALIAALPAALPHIRRFDAFPHVDETPLRAAWRRAGFRDELQHHVLSLAQAAYTPPSLPSSATTAGAADAVAAGALHEALFPVSYLRSADLMAATATHVGGNPRRLFVAASAGVVCGYAYVQQLPAGDEAYVDYLGVAPDARGHGLGRALLDAAVHWALVERALPRVSLTVRQDRSPALGLYFGAGFVEVAAGAHLVLERPA